MEGMRLIGKAAWLITALASIHVSIAALFGTEYDMVMRFMPAMAPYVYGLYLAAGLYSFVMLFMHCNCCE